MARAPEAGTYDRVARIYDAYSAPMEWAGGSARRRRLLAKAAGRVLEVGIGTGANLAYYGRGAELVGIDISERMLRRAARRATALRRRVQLGVADVTDLPFPDASFDTTVATCVFCSVRDPEAGLRELVRVTRPGGRVLLLEHVRPGGAVLGRLADVVTPLVRTLFGPEINRRTEETVAAAGLAAVEVRRSGVWREIVAVPFPATAVASGNAGRP